MTAFQSKPSAPRPEFSFSDDEFWHISKFAYSGFGLDLPLAKKSLVYARLSPRLRDLGLLHFREYILRLTNSHTDTESNHLISALTTNVTEFFREKHHFKFLASNVLPKLISKARSGRPIRIWSAGCSSGQEAYSIAMELLNSSSDIDETNTLILATDIDAKILHKAATGEYSEHEINSDNQLFKKFFHPPTSRKTNWKVDNKLQQMIQFGQLNLIDEWPMEKCFDVIFCRNVAIYFDGATQKKLWDRFSKALLNDGYLFIGHSERLDAHTSKFFRPVSITTYQKYETISEFKNELA